LWGIWNPSFKTWPEFESDQSAGAQHRIECNVMGEELGWFGRRMPRGRVSGGLARGVGDGCGSTVHARLLKEPEADPRLFARWMYWSGRHLFYARMAEGFFKIRVVESARKMIK